MSTPSLHHHRGTQHKQLDNSNPGDSTKEKRLDNADEHTTQHRPNVNAGNTTKRLDINTCVVVFSSIIRVLRHLFFLSGCDLFLMSSFGVAIFFGFISVKAKCALIDATIKLASIIPNARI